MIKPTLIALAILCVLALSHYLMLTDRRLYAVRAVLRRRFDARVARRYARYMGN